jgi:hypothetical protein
MRERCQGAALEVTHPEERLALDFFFLLRAPEDWAAWLWTPSSARLGSGTVGSW